MARFYSVAADGSLSEEKPDSEGIGTPEPGEHRLVVGAGVSGSEQKPAGNAGSTDKVEIVVRKKKARKADRWQCERNGLYYTEDGRCVKPSWRRYKKSALTRPDRIQTP